MTSYFCTYFDHRYLPRALALYRSIQEHCPDFRLWALCMDEAAYDLLAQLNLPNLTPVRLADFEENDEQLLTAKQNRSTIEYYFTCTPSLLLYVFHHWPEVDLLTYVDADLFLFSNPQPLYDDMQMASIGIIGHRFPPQDIDQEKYGKFNVGWLMFQRDENALACLQWWRERCNEWCYDRLEAGPDGDRFADQKYLDQWSQRFQGVNVLDHKGANLAPWNVKGYRLGIQTEPGALMVDDEPLIFFHFHGLKRIEPWLYNPQWEEYRIEPSDILRNKIYSPYVAILAKIYQELTPIIKANTLSGEVRNHAATTTNEPWLSRMATSVRRKGGMGIRILSGKHYILVIRGQPL